MKFEQFKKLLTKGIAALYDRDANLLSKEFGINERTITHRLALHLTPVFTDYDVDCEYNRMSDQNGYLTEGDYWAKTINISVEGHISGEDTEAKTVYPDIIIHKRKQPVNLAVIEVKMKWKNAKKDFDYKKLKAYKNDLKYDFAVYLELDEKEFLIQNV